MNNISNRVISLEEAKSALRCMRLSGLSEEESLESLDSFTERLRKVTTSQLVSDIIENKLTPTQRDFIKEYWYNGKNTSQIARDYGVSQSHVYRTIARANDTIKELMAGVIAYQQDLTDASLVPLRVKDSLKICAARNSHAEELGEKLKNLRIANAVPAEELAEMLGCSIKDLKSIESGKKIPPLSLLLRYSKIFGANITIELINGRSFYQCKKA